MAYSHKPKTSSELNQFHIIKTLKQLQKGLITVQECNLNKRFERLKREDKIWYDDLHPKYVAIVAHLNRQKTIS